VIPAGLWSASADPAAMLTLLEEGPLCVACRAGRHDKCGWQNRPSGSRCACRHCWGEDPGFSYRPSERKLRLFGAACCRLLWDQLVSDMPCPNAGRDGGTPYHDKHGCSVCGGTGRVNFCRRAVEVTERYADGRATEEEMWAADRGACQVTPYVANVLDATLWVADTRNVAWLEHTLENTAEYGVHPATQAALLRCVAGDPWRPAKMAEVPRYAPYAGDPSIWFDPDWLTWDGGTVRKLAQVAYEQRLPNGFLDPEKLKLLADAAEEAGCNEAAIVNHLRESDRPCPVVRWVSRRFHPQECVCAGTGLVPVPHARGCWAVDLFLGKE
jgi:hypothetical protein